jgi:hypothetical protein
LFWEDVRNITSICATIKKKQDRECPLWPLCVAASSFFFSFLQYYSLQRHHNKDTLAHNKTNEKRETTTMTIRTTFELILVDCSTLESQHNSPLMDPMPPFGLESRRSARGLFGDDGDDDDDSSLFSNYSDDSSVLDMSFSYHDECSYTDEVMALLDAYEGLYVGGGEPSSTSRNQAIQSLLSRLEGLASIEQERPRRQREEDDNDSVVLARTRGISSRNLSQVDENEDDDADDEDDSVCSFESHVIYTVPLKDAIAGSEAAEPTESRAAVPTQQSVLAFKPGCLRRRQPNSSTVM